MKPIAYIDHVSGKPKLIDGYVVQTAYDIPLYNTPQTKPLSDADIQQISHRYHYTYNPDYVGFARAIEERHGIK